MRQRGALISFLFQRLDELGIDPEQVMHEFVEARGTGLRSENRLRRVLNRRYRLELIPRKPPAKPVREEDTQDGDGE